MISANSQLIAKTPALNYSDETLIATKSKLIAYITFVFNGSRDSSGEPDQLSKYTPEMIQEFLQKFEDEFDDSLDTVLLKDSNGTEYDFKKNFFKLPIGWNIVTLKT